MNTLMHHDKIYFLSTMNISLYLNILNELKTQLTRSEKNKIHYNSIFNFIIHYEEIKGHEKETIANLIERYFAVIKKLDYRVSTKDSREIYFKYIVKIGQYYNFQLGFKVYMKWDVSLFIGVIIDLVLLILGVLKLIYYIPVCSILLIVYDKVLFFKYSQQGKLYGIEY